MTKDEAMKLALEWMETIVNSNWRNWGELASPEEFERWVKIRANHSAVVLRQALEQPEQVKIVPGDYLKQSPVQPKQEPVAWVGEAERGYRDIDWDKEALQRVYPFVYPLYAAPPKREWVGLNNVEVGRLTVFDGLHHVETPVLAEFVRAIEAKLKEKNT